MVHLWREIGERTHLQHYAGPLVEFGAHADVNRSRKDCEVFSGRMPMCRNLITCGDLDADDVRTGLARIASNDRKLSALRQNRWSFSPLQSARMSNNHIVGERSICS